MFPRSMMALALALDGLPTPTHRQHISRPETAEQASEFMVKVYRPAAGHTSILSTRRQARKAAVRKEPRLASGRQWTKYRKFAKRSGLFDFYSLPTYMVKTA